MIAPELASTPTTVPVVAIIGNSSTRRSRVCVNYRVSQWCGPLVMQPNGKRTKVSSKSGRIIEYIPERKWKVVWDEDGSRTEELGKSLRFI